MIRAAYHAVVRRRVLRVFAQLSENRWDLLLKDMADDVHHVFPGDHPLGGERHDKEAIAGWFRRLTHLFPGHVFNVEGVAVTGWPWDTWACVRWTARLTPQVGPEYTNDGTHWLHVRWGTVDALHAYVDSQRVAEACAAMATAGVDGAAASPIVS